MKKLVHLIIMVPISIYTYGQTNNIIGVENNLSPYGFLDTVFDQYGNKYSLAEVKIEAVKYAKTTNAALSTSTTPVVAGYYNLYFESGCGMEGLNATEIARQNVVVRLFQDISAFINSPLTTSGKKVNIWVRNINNVVPSPNGVLGLATSFYNIPYNTAAGFGGIADNEVWKTIHLGEDSYKGVVSPLSSTGVSSGTSGLFYHGMISFNFTDTATPINWHTTLTSQTATGLYDLYSVMLHEVTHALGFASLINSSGNSKLGAGFNYYSRYDAFLKNNANTQFLITRPVSACGTMYNYNFNTALSTTVLQPTYTTTTYVTNALKFVGLSPATTVPVYTPTTFDPPSSLSHFEGKLYSTGTATSPYPFTMNMSLGTALNRRYLKAEERNVLINLGYSVNTTFGATANLNYFNYGGTTATGINVAGMNDGINAEGTYKYIANSGTNIILNSATDTAIRILTNDPNAASFECLQDVFDTTATIPTTSGTATTNVTFSSAVPGIHLLRYVPINAAGLKGNIVYIYVYVSGNCANATACNLVSNGGFENSTNCGQLGVTNPLPTIQCWELLAQSPDLFKRNCTSAFNVGINTYMNVPAVNSHNNAPNNNFIGLYRVGSTTNFSNNSWLEGLQTILSSPLIVGETYQLSFWARGGNQSTNISSSIPVNFSSHNNILTPISLQGNNFQTVVPDSNMIVPTTLVPNDNFWHFYSIVFTMPSTISLHNALSIYTGASTSFATYIYVDDISITPLNGGSFTLPTTLCANQSLPDLSVYLSGLPSNGVFSGESVLDNGGIYSLEPSSISSVGVKTITYTYTNASGCQVNIYSNINVISNIVPDLSISGPSSAYTITGTNITTHLISTGTPIPNNYIKQWSITQGAGTFTSANGQNTITTSWTTLPAMLTLTLTSPEGCSFSEDFYIENSFLCDCLTTQYFTSTVNNNLATFTVMQSNPLCPNTLNQQWNFGDGIIQSKNTQVVTHSYSTTGTKTVSINSKRYNPLTVIYDAGAICFGNYTRNLAITQLPPPIEVEFKNNNHTQKKEVSIYPNPASTELSFSFYLDAADTVNVFIYDIVGKKLLNKEWKLEKGNQELKVILPNNLAEGYVMVHLQSKTFDIQKKIIIKK